MTKCPKLLDCTLRDGSYVVDFQFTASDTTVISKAISRLSFPYIEVGHGMGLGGSQYGWPSGASDKEYMVSACGNWGVFAIPGIATIDNIKECADAGAAFIRIGCNIGDFRAGEPYIRAACDLGLYVFSNLMKSYLATPDEFAEAVTACEGYGAQCVYIVDSAGCMTWRDIENHMTSVRRRSSIPLGFHGHNNLNMAMSNALACAISGEFDVIDVSLLGVGRGGGNVASEQFIALLGRHGIDAGYDLIEVMNVGENYIRPIVGAKAQYPLDVVCGMAGFHSSYMPQVIAAAKAHKADPRRIILKLGATPPTPQDIDAAASSCAGTVERCVSGAYYGDEENWS